uniref:Large ribosomal subunit protein bL28c n=1 Tax=Balbiania investiens TaxID=111861 RepID=A0A4D6BP13_9FLOR|nr:ribosomal protein L28 [Balbiania investiens]QBX88683.1 ribosomal protein L28 [Balbiania investiens]
MPRKCQITGKTKNNGYAVSHSHIRTKKIQAINLQNKKLWIPVENKWIKLRISTKAIRNLIRNQFKP